jgi:hypothetical protein
MASRLFLLLSAVASASAWPAGLKLATFDGNKTTTHSFIDSAHETLARASRRNPHTQRRSTRDLAARVCPDATAALPAVNDPVMGGKSHSTWEVDAEAKV